MGVKRRIEVKWRGGIETEQVSIDRTNKRLWTWTAYKGAIITQMPRKVLNDTEVIRHATNEDLYVPLRRLSRLFWLIHFVRIDQFLAVAQ